MVQCLFGQGNLPEQALNHITDNDRLVISNFKPVN